MSVVAAASAAAATVLLIFFLLYPVRRVKVIGIAFHGFLFKHQSVLAEKLAELAMSEFANMDVAGISVLNKETILLIDTHLDAYLKVRLKEKLPVIATFIGDKTVVKLKESMLEEIEILLPEVLKKHLAGIGNNVEVATGIESLISGISTDRIIALTRPVYKKMIATIPFIFGLVAAIVTFVLCVIFSLFM